MSDREQLPCASCGKVGGLGEEVTTEATGWVPCKVYAKPGGGVEVKKGGVESHFDEEISDVQEIACTDCGTTFDSWEAATADKPVEYRCGKCDWWGLQDWLHVDCDGELTEHPVPLVGA